MELHGFLYGPVHGFLRGFYMDLIRIYLKAFEKVFVEGVEPSLVLDPTPLQFQIYSSSVNAGT